MAQEEIHNHAERIAMDALGKPSDSGIVAVLAGQIEKLAQSAVADIEPEYYVERILGDGPIWEQGQGH